MMNSARLYHLDALRAFAILYGVLVHAATIGVPAPLQLFARASEFFRMGTFFLVSGFFAAMLLARLGRARFLRHRATALLVPLVSGLVLLNPVTNYLIHIYHNGPLSPADYLALVRGPTPAGLRGPAVWHLHLWFLISLSFYVATAPLAVGLARAVAGPRASRTVEMLSALPRDVFVIGVAISIAVTALGLRIGYEALLDPVLTGTGAVWLVRITLYYWPFFLVGLALFHQPLFFERFHHISLPGLLIGVAAVGGTSLLVPTGSDALLETADLLSKAFLTGILIAALLALFRRHAGGPTWLSRTAGFVYSIYIVHFLVIYLLAYAIMDLPINIYLRFALIAAGTYAAVFALHRFVISPSPLLSLLFNGKPMR